MDATSARSRRGLGWALAACLALVPLAPAATADAGAPSCIQIEDVTAFAPRGEVYVRVKPLCGEDDFGHEDSFVAYLEVIVSDFPPAGEDVRVHRDAPRRATTYVFRDLTIDHGDPLLVRLVRFDEIVSLVSIKVP
jgi:hypothetical protein